MQFMAHLLSSHSTFKSASKYFYVLANALPYLMGSLYGSVIMEYNEDGCNAMLVSSTNSKVYVCSGLYTWNSYTVSKVNGVMVKMDYNAFMI